MRRKRQNRKGTAGRVYGPLAAFVLAAAFVIGAPPLSGQAWAVELERECSFQVLPVTEGGSIAEGQPGEKVDVAIDLYLVAQAREVGGYDTYDYYVSSDSPYYTGIASFVQTRGDQGWEYEQDEAGLTFRYSPRAEGEGWEALARETASAGLAENAELSPTASGEAGSTLSGLDAGLYLVVARGGSLDRKADYVTELDTEDGRKELVTTAYSDDCVYRFRPQLISLPSRRTPDGNIGTADPGEWLYDLAGMELKFDLDSRFVSLEIVKGITRYASPATFVFEVEASREGRVVYSDIVTLSFDEESRGDKSVLLEDKIPAGADVIVTEIYSGADYSLTGITASAVGGEAPEGTSYTADLASGRAVITAISAGNIGSAEEGVTEGTGIVSRVTFTNDYNGSGNGGGGVTNHFEWDGGEAGWNWNQYRYNAGSGRWEWNGALPAVTDTTVR